MIEFPAIIKAVQTAKAIEKFVEGELAGILSGIADNEYKAATNALSNISRAKRPRDQILLAVGHLNSAHVSYRGIYESKGWRDYFTLAGRMAALNKDTFTLALLAICYRYLREPLLMQDALEQALLNAREWKKYTREYTLGDLADPGTRETYLSGVASAIGGWFNAGNWDEMYSAARGTFPDVKEEELLELCKFLKYKPQLTPGAI
jgi:hypothetical protein